MPPPVDLLCAGLPFARARPLRPTDLARLRRRIARERRWLLAGQLASGLVLLASLVLTTWFAVEALDPEGNHPPALLVLVFFGFLLLALAVGAGIALAVLFPRTRVGFIAVSVMLAAFTLLAWIASLTESAVVGGLTGCLGIALACMGIGHLLRVPFALISRARLTTALEDLDAGIVWEFAGFVPYDEMSSCPDLRDPDAPEPDENAILDAAPIWKTADVLPRSAVAMGGDDSFTSGHLRPLAPARSPYRGVGPRALGDTPVDMREMIASERLELGERLRMHDAETLFRALALLYLACFGAVLVFVHVLSFARAGIPIAIVLSSAFTARHVLARIRERRELRADLDGGTIVVRVDGDVPVDEPIEWLPRSETPWTFKASPRLEP